MTSIRLSTIVFLCASFWIYSYVLVPICSLSIPFLSSTSVCRVVSPKGLVLHKLSKSQLDAQPASVSFICSVPFFGTTTACLPPLDRMPPMHDIQQIVDSQFNHFGALVQVSRETPSIVHNIRDFGMALQDLIIMVEHSDLHKRTAVINELRAIKEASEVSSRRLQAYAARLDTTVTIFLASAEEIVSLMSSEASVVNSIARRTACYFNLIDNCNPSSVQNAFVHTLQTFEMLLGHLAHHNALTDQSLNRLGSHIDVLKYIAAEEKDLASKEIGELLGRMWTRLGGNSKPVANVRQRFNTLIRMSEQTKLMRRLVSSVQDELQDLKVSSEALRAYAAQPLLLESEVPKGGVIRALSEGCRGLRDRMNGIRNQQLGEEGELQPLVEGTGPLLLN